MTQKILLGKHLDIIKQKTNKKRKFLQAKKNEKNFNKIQKKNKKLCKDFY
jgi:hypothetical protein